MSFCIIETDDGLTIAACDQVSAEQIALDLGARLVDPGPFDTYEDATEALVSLEEELDDEADVSDVPGSQALEDREMPE